MTLVQRNERRRLSVYHRFVDIMLTMCFAHCICFDGFKQDPLNRSTIFDSIINYIFSLLKAIYSVVFAFVSHHF